MCPSLKKGGKEKKTPGLVWGRKMLFVARSEGSRALAVPPLISHSVAVPGKTAGLLKLRRMPTYQGYVTTLGPSYTLTYLRLIFVTVKGNVLTLGRKSLTPAHQIRV